MTRRVKNASGVQAPGAFLFGPQERVESQEALRRFRVSRDAKCGWREAIRHFQMRLWSLVQIVIKGITGSLNRSMQG
jgi:hypothetical protein